jgi:hypothetical protein
MQKIFPSFDRRCAFMGAVSISRVIPGVSIAGFLIALIVAHVVATPAYAATCETSSTTLAASPSGETSTPAAIVVGFLGGFVARDEAHHPEVQMMRDLRQEYPKYVYFGLFENRKVGTAYKAILNILGATQDGTLSDNKKRRACILLFGHSWGASAVVTLARKLASDGIPVTVTVQVDSVAKPFRDDRIIPSNVLQAANFYQVHGLIHGRQRIVPADPSRTTILGNFLFEYKEEPKECRDFPWYARFFTKSHIEIECDPKVWSQVKTLLRSNLPAPAVTRTDSGEPHPGSAGIDRGAALPRWRPRKRVS